MSGIPPAHPDIIDEERVERLRKLFGEHFREKMGMFLGNAQSYVDGIGNALAVSNREEAVALAHKVRSSAGQFGMLQVPIFAEQLEYSGMEAERETLLWLHMQLQQAFTRASHVLREIV